MFPILLIQGIPSSPCWGEHVCVWGYRVYQALPSTRTYRFCHTDVQDTHWQRGYRAPVPFRKDKTQVTDVGTIALPMAFSLLFFHGTSANVIRSHYSSDMQYWAPVNLSLPLSHTSGVYIKGVFNRFLQSLQHFNSLVLAVRCMLEYPFIKWNAQNQL